MSRIISVPWRPGPGGLFAKEPDRKAQVESRMYQILFTNPHERFMRNDLGVPMMDWIFEPVDLVFVALVETHARPMIEHWIKDIQVSGIQVSREEVESANRVDTVVSVAVLWRDLLTSNQFDSDFQHTFQRAQS